MFVSKMALSKFTKLCSSAGLYFLYYIEYDTQTDHILEKYSTVIDATTRLCKLQKGFNTLYGDCVSHEPIHTNKDV